MKHRPIGVCMIVEDLPVPFDRRTWQEALALHQAGYRVSVVSRRGRGFEARYENREGVEIHRHSVWEASGPWGYLFEYAWALAAQFFLAIKIFARTRFRVLHAGNPPDTMFLIGAFFKLFGVRFIFDHHDLSPELYEAKFGRRGALYKVICLAERLTYRAAVVSIATNQSYREIAIARGRMKPERVFVVRSSPDARSIRPGPGLDSLKEGQKYLVVYLGVMGPQDGLDLLLDSIEWVVKQKNRQDILFVLIGAGTELARLRSLAAQKGLGSVAKFTGRIPDQELALYLATADVGVAPDPLNTMNDKSTMNKILQYMAYGRPVVLYELTEGRRSAGDAALYARPNDPVDFAEQILKLLDSETLRRELGERGRKRSQESFNWETDKKVLLEAYKMALKLVP